MKQPEGYPTKKQCGHGYAKAKRVNDILLLGKYYRQMKCTQCGAYKFKINPEGYHPIMQLEAIKINEPAPRKRKAVN